MSTPDNIAHLKDEILQLISSDLNPLRERYHYGDYDLQNFVSWQPIVLIIGNYSAGKSTFINELLNQDIQRTGQAPTDDCFTVISYQSHPHKEVVEERDGRVLLGDHSLPFRRLKSQGERFLSHFRSKKVHAEILRNLVLIDTPGMLDSISEKDRGYHYQEVIGELASIADLVILIFDAHKAGTVRESYQSLRTTLPKATMEDRVLFVLNRVDECQNLDDLMRVHGALCWNLSQMTGRKDIPRIYLTFSPPRGELTHIKDSLLRDYLKEMAHQKKQLIHQILDVPRKRIDHLATYLDIHAQRMLQFICAYEAWSGFKRQSRYVLAQWITLSAALVGTAFIMMMTSAQAFSSMISWLMMIVGVGLMMRSWLNHKFFARSKKHFLNNMESFVTVNSQYEKDHWNHIAPTIKQVIRKKDHLLPHRKQIRMHKKDLKDICERVDFLRHNISSFSLDHTQNLSDHTLNLKLHEESQTYSNTQKKMTQIIKTQIGILNTESAESKHQPSS